MLRPVLKPHLNAMLTIVHAAVLLDPGLVHGARSDFWVTTAISDKRLRAEIASDFVVDMELANNFHFSVTFNH